LLDVHVAVVSKTALAFSTGTVNATVIREGPPVTFGVVGAFGTATATAALDSPEMPLVPARFVALRSHVYVLPLVRPVTSIGEIVPELLAGRPPSGDGHVAVYDVIGAPLSAGGVNATCITFRPDVTLGAAGALGASTGRTGADSGEFGPVPAALAALT
jgi:hypothetical protein